MARPGHGEGLGVWAIWSLILMLKEVTDRFSAGQQRARGGSKQSGMGPDEVEAVEG